MLKIIKKTLSVIIVPGAIIALVPLVIILLFRIPYIQTYFARGLAGYISNRLNTTISVGDIEFSYFNKLIIKNLLIKDQNLDTLIYVPKITAGIRRLNPGKGVFHFGRILVEKPVFALITDTANVMNLNWYLDKITVKKDTVTTSPTPEGYFKINRIDVQDGRFALLNYREGPSGIPIDFNKLHVDSINGTIEELTVVKDSTTMDISGLSFVESNGFISRKMNGSLSLIGQNIIFRKVYLESDSSILNSAHIALYPDSANGFRNFLSEVHLDIDIGKSLVTSSDIRYFVPFFKGYNESLYFSGKVSGTISELKGRSVKIQYKDETSIDFDFDLSGLPDIDNTFIFLEINDFRSASGDIEQVTIPGKGKILLPEVLRKLGVVSFTGTFTGFTTDFVAYGKINTGKGLITTDVSLRPEGKNRFRIKGLIKGTGIDLGSIAENTDLLGGMTMQANIDGYTESFKKLSVSLTGNIDSIEINSYRYRNIAFNGSFNDKAWDGDIRVQDENLSLDLLGMFDFNGELPEFDFTLNLKNANLYRLNIDKKDTTSGISLLLTANFSGNSIDNLDGEIRLLNSNFRKFGGQLEVYDFSLKTFIENSQPALSLRTDFADANLYGRYSFSGLSKVVGNALAAVIPSKFTAHKNGRKDTGNNFVFDVRLKNSDRLNEFLKTGLEIGENSTISGGVQSDSILSVKGYLKKFVFGSNTFSDLSLNAFYDDSAFTADIKTISFDLSGVTEMKDLEMKFTAHHDNFDINLLWDNKEKVVNKGNFTAKGTFSPIEGNVKKAKLQVALLPGEVYSGNNLWKINPALISIDSNSIKLDRFLISNRENFISIEGALSEDLADTLRLNFNGIDLDPVNSLYEKRMGNDPEMIRLAIGGTFNGTINLTNVFRNFMFESDIIIKNFSLLNSNYGDITILSSWNNSRNVMDLNASNNFKGAKMLDIRGYYDPSSQFMDIAADADKLPIDALNPLLSTFASGISGTATGRVKLSGKLSEPVLTGAVKADNASMKIDYLQSKYTFNDSIRFDKAGIRFNNVIFRDEKGNTASLNGIVYNKYFKDFSVDLNIRMNECMVLNTRSKDNELFYGTAYGSGLTSIKTIGPLLKFDISAKTGKNTKFFIPLNTGMSVSQNSFISFVEPHTESGKNTASSGPKEDLSNSSGIEIAFDLNVTPDAEVQMIMDPKIGDIIKGTGSGNLNINLDRKGVLKIFGDYKIENGSYLFTLGNIINKQFDVESGGKVTFNGDIDNADIDIKAIYRTKASLNEINPALFASEQQKERIPVECQLLLTGKLLSPIVAFDIYLPTADEETRAYLKSMIKSEEDMSRQFLFLLVMGSFYADQSSTSSQPNIGTSVAGLTTMEMLSTQLSNWLSQISNDFDILVNYRPGSSNLSNSQELKVALSTQLLNDKVIINGNFDVAGAPGSASSTSGQASATGTNTITGAFDIEYKINEKIRFKVFNRSNDNFYIDNGIQYTQGIGILYREEYNKLRDVFKKKPKGDMKQEKEVKPEKK
jgi:hypothetical protein